MVEHHKYGGSTASRTKNCPRWKCLADQNPIEDTSSSAADRGTMLHDCCERLDTNPALEFEDLLALDIKCGDHKLTEDLLYTKVVPAFDEAEAIFDIYDAEEVEAELHVKLDELVGGYIDRVGLSKDGKTLIILDYKFGEGIMVYANESDQFPFYAWCALFSAEGIDKYPNVEKVVLAVVQPSEKRDSYSDLIEVTIEQIEEFGIEMDKAITIAEECYATPNNTDHLKEGDWCKFCPNAKSGACPVKHASAEEALTIRTDEGDFDDKLPRALDLAERLKPWIKEVEAYALMRAEEGNKPKGWKLVEKRAQRKWKDEKKAADAMVRYLKTANAYERKLITPAKAEQVCKRLDVDFDKYIEKHIVKESSGTTLVRESDKREEVIVTPDNEALKSLFETN